jgi:hypothetical protein
VGANVTTYAATGLSPSTSYSFRVRATNSAGDSAYSNAASATTAAAPAGGADVLGPYSRPSAATTGLSNPSLLTARSTTLTTTSDGQVIENLDFTGGAGILVLNNNVIIRNCRISGIISAGGEGAARTNVRAEDCEFFGTDTGGLGRGVSLYRCYVHGLRDSDFWRNPGDCTWEGNYFTDVYATGPTPHIDIIQWYWSNPAQRVSAANLTVRGNYWNIDNTYPYANQFNAILFNDMDMTNITWEDNWMKSGGYVIRNHVNSATVQINNNIFEGWGWGPMLQRNGYSDVGFSGNQVLRNGTLQPFEKPPGANSDLFGLA